MIKTGEHFIVAFATQGFLKRYTWTFNLAQAKTYVRKYDAEQALKKIKNISKCEIDFKVYPIKLKFETEDF